MRYARLVLGLVILLLAGYLTYGLATSQPTVISVAALCSIAVLVLVLAAAILSKSLSSAWPDHANFAQGFAAIVTVFALFIAAGIYFLERRDRPRISYTIESTVLRPTTTNGPLDRVLLSIRIPVENKSSRQIEIRCMALDILTPPEVGELMRNPDFGEELRLNSIGERIRSRSKYADACMRGEERLHRLPSGSLRPLYIWPPLRLEPQEIDDRHFETLVSCDNPFVRVLVKMRINPGDNAVYETKTIVPLTDTCSGESESSRGISTPTVEGGAAREE